MVGEMVGEMVGGRMVSSSELQLIVCPVFGLPLERVVNFHSKSVFSQVVAASTLFTN